MRLERVFALKFAAVYPLYVRKAEAKGRTQAEVDEVIRWLTGYSAAGLRKQRAGDNDLQAFFAKAPRFNPDADLVTGRSRSRSRITGTYTSPGSTAMTPRR